LISIKAKALENSLVRSRKIWCKQEVREPAPFLVCYMGKGSLRIIRNESPAIATNSYLMLYPQIRKEDLSPEILQELFLILSHATCEENLDVYGRLYGGGLHKVEPKELGEIPIEAPSTALIESLSRFVLEW